MSYEYLTTADNGNLVYRVTLEVYRDCRSGQVPLDDNIKMGVYVDYDERALYKEVSFTLIENYEVDPPGTVLCDFYDSRVCVEYGFYQGTIQVPPSNTGYHMTYVRCCRNKQDNITDQAGTPNQGQTYYCYIPGKLYENSSPVFSGVPSPYMCSSDTTTFDFSAYDKDGDKLTYKLVHPYAGGALGASAPDPAAQYDDIDSVQFRAGYTYTTPFGNTNGSFVTVDAQSGLTTIFAPDPGSYIMAVEVTETRDGVKLSTVRMDLQILVLKCPPNDRPNITAIDGQDFTIEEGEPLCFSVKVNDPDGDNVKVTAKGPIYDGSNNYQGPKAILYTQEGVGKTDAKLCWTPECGQARDEPYFVTLTAQDDGCPPKFNTADFSITVTPFIGSDEIIGPLTVCRYKLSTYTAVDPNENSIFKWMPVGGTIVGKVDSSVVQIYWYDTVARLAMAEVSQFGCVGDTTEIEVIVRESPPLPEILGKDTICEVEMGLSYTTKLFDATNTYTWEIDGGTLASTDKNVANIGTYGLQGFTIKVVEANSTGCVSDTAKLDVVVSVPDPKLIGPTRVCPYSSDVRYFVPNTSGSVFSWGISGGLLTSIKSDTVYVSWGGLGTGTITVTETNRFGCKSAPYTLNVVKDHLLDVTIPRGPIDACEFDLGVPYETDDVSGSVFTWDIVGGTQSSGDSSHSISVDWGAAGTGKVGVQQKAYDLVNGKICLSPMLYMDVVIHPRPSGNLLSGPTELCQLQDTAEYSVTGWSNSTFEWAIDGQVLSESTNTLKWLWSTAGTFSLTVVEVSEFGCRGPEIEQIIVVNPKPQTSAITGPDVLCVGDWMTNVYSVTGDVNSQYTWDIGGSISFTGQGTNQVVVDWDSTLPGGYLRVVETSDKGCAGDERYLEVLFDRLDIDLRFVSVGTPDDRMHISWQYGNSSSANSFTIEKRVPGDPIWTQVAIVSGTIFDYTETNINTDESAFEYRVTALNKCGDLISSEIHTSILLKAFGDEDFNVHVEFSDYLGWDNGVQNYEINTSVNSMPYVPVMGALPNTLVIVVRQETEYRKCFRVQAFELGGGEETSWSNEVCFTYRPAVYVPNAFTINNDNLNETFGFKTVAVKSLEIEIYNRWGELLFSSDDINARWDGTYNGEIVPVGTYLYQIKFTDFEDKPYYKSGTVHLIR